MSKPFAVGAAASVAAFAASVLALSAAGPAAAQQAQYTSKDIIDTFAKKPPPAPAPAPPPGECEKKGMVTGEDGVCEPTKNARGFSLPTRASMAKANAAPAAAPAPAPAASSRPATRPMRTASASPPRPVAAAAPAAHRDLLITFKLGSAELTDQAKANAKVFAQALASPVLADAKFDIAGYTDVSGDKDKNLALSEARAAAVKAFLVSQGVPEGRLQAHGFGATDFAVADPASPKNRRVEAKRTE